MHERLDKARCALEELGLGAMVITKIENVRYLSGFTGSSAIGVVTPVSALLVTDGRYREQAAAEAPEWDIVIYAADAAEAVASLVKDSGAGEAGFEESVSYHMHRRLGDALGASVSLRPVENLVERLRARKDPSETALIRASAACARSAYREVLPLVVPGATERELAAELDHRMTLAGANGPAFDTVVASGPNSSLPHAGITDRALAEGDLVVMDFGARKDGYCSDTSRTLDIGEPDARRSDILDTLQNAFERALSVIRPGLPARDADAAAREALKESGMDGYFVHGLGHGVGLEVHERPTLSARSEDTLEPGMVFTVEPGIYIEAWGGARLEEMVLLTASGPEILGRCAVD